MNTELWELYIKIMNEAKECEITDPGYAQSLREHAENILKTMYQ